MDKQPETTPRLLIDVRNAAKALSICERTLATLTKEGEIPHVRVRTRVLYDPRALAAWIDDRSQGGGLSVDGIGPEGEK
ncbi:MAG: helix-turn-helix domain-containing protein [Pirellulaceae bacterium]|nr:helix-turn-helix domain-containing protein [Pirellulaceae bacterium]